MTSEQAMTVGQIRVVRGWAQLMMLAWRRAWQFTGLFRRNTRATMAASRSWSWQWAVVTWQACALYPTCLITAGMTAAEIWVATGTGSARSHRVDRKQRVTLPGLVLAVGVALVLACALLALLVAGMLSGPILGLVVVPALLLFWVLGLGLSLVRSHPEGLRQLGRRARQLTDGPAVVLTDVVVGKQDRGDGSRLMRSLQDRWTRDGIAVAVLYAGSDDLVTFYRDVVGGWALDEGSARRMIWAGESR